MIYQFTKDMLKSLKVEPEDYLEDYDDLYTWNVKKIRINRRHLVYLMNNATKISVIFYGMTQKEYKNFDKIANEGIRQVLIDGQVDDFLIEAYLKDVNKNLYTTVGSRRQMGVLNNAAYITEYLFDDFQEDSLLQRKMSYFQNKLLKKCEAASGNVIPLTQIKKMLKIKYKYS